MKRTNVLLVVLGAYAVGVLSGLLWAAYKGPPPALDGRPASTQHPVQQEKAADKLDPKIAAMEKAIQADPNNGRLYIQTGDLLFDGQRYEQALTYYEKAIAILGEQANVLTDMGVVYRRLGQPQKAVEYFKKAQKADPTHKPSAYNLGIVLLHDLQDKSGALEAWRQYLALDPQGERAEHIRQVMAQLERAGKESSTGPE